MPRSIHRKDGTHDEIVKALRDVGVAVESMVTLGGGRPDLLCAIRQYVCWVECKVPGEPLRKSQVEFMARWPGDVWVAESGKEAVAKVVEGARKVFGA
jgi:hypothetical protein